MRTRHSYKTEYKKEIAQGYYTRQLSAKDIEAKGIRMNNVHRWVKMFFGPGGRAKGGEPAPESAPIEVHNLSLRKLRRGANGRYREKDKDVVMSALLELPVSEVSEKTGVNVATLYAWKEAASKEDAPINGSPRPADASKNAAVVPANGARQPLHRTAELLVNPETTEGLLDGIRKMEGFTNLTKAVENKIKKFRAGIIEFDEDDHRLCMSYLQITGGKPPMRVRK